MKVAAWLACWPILGVMAALGVVCVVFDAAFDATYDLADRLQDYAEAE